MIIDPHNHILGTALTPGHERFIKEMRGAPLRASGQLPNTRPPEDEDWEAFKASFNPIHPDTLIAHHDEVGIDLSVMLTVAPSDYTAYGQRGTVDLAGITDVEGELSIDLANDYIASLARTYPKLLGMAAVNPRYRGIEAAKTELERATGELGMAGLKLYPMYDQYRIDDPDVSMPVLEHAERLGVSVMVHMGLSPARDAVLEYGNPLAIDEVARAFPDLNLLVCHAGFPWVDDCLAVVGRHENTYMDVSYFIEKVSQKEIHGFLERALQLDCPWTRICWATDYPGGGLPSWILPKFALVDEVREGGTEVGREQMAQMLGGNWARFARLQDWDLDETIAQIDHWEPRWRELWEQHDG